MSNFNTYLEKIDKQFHSGLATEHSYRLPFQNYLESLLPDVLVTNEAKRSKVGAPDFIITDKKNIPFAYIETKGRDIKVEKGKILRGFHLLESEAVEDNITTFPNNGDNIVGKPKWENNKVWLNVTQYFDGVPEAVWNFYIGGFQPAQKWLKDRVGRKLGFEEVLHYQKIVCALAGTVRVMGEMA
jgi:hypothetical protein